MSKIDDDQNKSLLKLPYSSVIVHIIASRKNNFPLRVKTAYIIITHSLLVRSRSELLANICSMMRCEYAVLESNSKQSTMLYNNKKETQIAWLGVVVIAPSPCERGGGGISAILQYANLSSKQSSHEQKKK